MEKKSPTREEMEKVIRECIDRIINGIITNKGTSSDALIDCPKCGKSRSIEIESHSPVWLCLTRECGFKFPEDLRPPSPQEIADDYRLKKRQILYQAVCSPDTASKLLI
jgi:ribosomal protein L37AE/L43A